MPVVVVATFYNGMPPQQIEADITNTFERFFTLGANIDHSESRSLTGVSLIKIYFKPGTDPNAAVSNIANLAMADLRRLPPGTLPPVVLGMDASTQPVCLVTLKGQGLNETSLKDLAQFQVRNQISNVQGASVPQPYGGTYRQIQIYVDPLKLEARNLLCCPVSLLAAQTAATAAGDTPSIGAKTSGMQRMPGFLPLYWNAKTGKLYLEIPHLNTDMVYFDSLPYGTGSNDLGLDRGQISRAKLVRFERFGPRILLVQPSEYFRSSSQNPAEQLAVRQSFPDSVLAGFAVEAENAAAAADAGAVLVDATEFFLRDAHGVLDALVKQGPYKLDAARSSIVIDATRVFPKNTEVEAVLTFASDAPVRGSFVAEVAPDPHALTVREHHSFLELPEPGYVPRRYDPRAGYFQFVFRDYAAALGAPLEQMFILRHRLIKQDPTCVSECAAVKPIQYYVDRGAPEPIRSALVEGASWWDQAFHAAGWAPGTFRVNVLPGRRAEPGAVRSAHVPGRGVRTAAARRGGRVCAARPGTRGHGQPYVRVGGRHVTRGPALLPRPGTHAAHRARQRAGKRQPHPLAWRTRPTISATTCWLRTTGCIIPSP